MQLFSKKTKEGEEQEKKSRLGIAWMRECAEKTKKEMEKGDPKAWYQFWMGTLIFFTGILLISVVLLDFAFELYSFRAERSASVVSSSEEQKLPPGEYIVLRTYASRSIGEDGEQREAVEVCKRNGGTTVLVLLPKTMHLPKPDSNEQAEFVLDVDKDGVWSFLQPVRIPKEKQQKPEAGASLPSGDGKG